jgi:2C-methyl-D-erythritol 2,4-cyclodiphosphate synthase
MSITFPDNDNRENRMNQLASDINSSIITESNAEKEINSKITELSDIAQEMVKKLEPDLEVAVDTINLYKTTWDITEIVVPALVFTAAYNALSIAVASSTLTNAAEGAVEEGSVLAGEMVAEAAEELAIPVSAKLIAGAGGLVLAVGIGFAVDAIDGSIARKKLRKEIHSLVGPRVTQKMNELKVTKLLEEVGSMLDAYQMMQKLGYTKEQMEGEIELTIEKFKPELEAITPDVAKQQLAILDKGRGSWTKED